MTVLSFLMKKGSQHERVRFKEKIYIRLASNFADHFPSEFFVTVEGQFFTFLHSMYFFFCPGSDLRVRCGIS